MQELYLPFDPEVLFQLDMNIYWLDRNGIYQGCNQHVLELIGVTEDQIIGRNNQQLIELGILTPQLAAHIDHINHLVLTTKKPQLNVPDPMVVHRNGKPIYYMTHRFPLFDADNNVAGILGMTVDRTEKLLIEQSGLFGYLIAAAGTDRKQSYGHNFMVRFHEEGLEMPISPQEAKCLYYLLKGLSAREISEKLYISMRTAEGHIAHAKEKLGCKTRSELFDRLLNDIALLSKMKESLNAG